MQRHALVVAATSLTLLACPHTRDERVLASKVVGSEGGRIEAEGIVLDIPAGAMSGSERIEIHIAPAGTAAAISPLTQVISFEPDGLEFDKPIQLAIDVPGGEGGAVWWSSLDDPAVFEFAGFADRGVARAENTHFSDVAVGAPTCADDDPDGGDCEGCEQGEEGEAACPSCDGEQDEDSVASGLCATSLRDRCRNLCVCRPNEPQVYTQPLCATQPANMTSYCPPSDQVPSNDGARYVGEHDGEACSGWSWEPRRVHLCYCNGPVTTPSPVPLCPIAWSNDATTPGTYTWACHSTLDWGLMSTSGLPAATTPTPGDQDLYADRTLHAYVKEGQLGVNCLGHYLDQSKSPAEDVTSTAGTLQCDEILSEVDYRWREQQGTSAECTPFEWWPGMTRPELSDEDKTRCRLSKDEWQRLQDARGACGLSSRDTASSERATRRAERQQQAAYDAAGQGQKVVPKKFATVSILDVPTEPEGASKQFVGTNSGSRAQRAQADPAQCPGGTVQGDWIWTGYTMQRSDGSYYNSNVTQAHAEGDATLQLAEQRGRTPAQPDSPTLSEGGRGGGCADMLVDRRACFYSCAAEGIERVRQASGLDELIVRSPGGCRSFHPFGGNRGQPCPSDTYRCPK